MEVKEEDDSTSWKYGLIDRAGKIVLDPVYEFLIFDENGLASLRIGGWLDGKYGLVNSQGEVIFDAVYDYIGSFSEGYCIIRGEDDWYFFDTSGDIVL